MAAQVLHPQPVLQLALHPLLDVRLPALLPQVAHRLVLHVLQVEWA